MGTRIVWFRGGSMSQVNPVTVSLSLTLALLRQRWASFLLDIVEEGYNRNKHLRGSKQACI